MIRPTLRTVLGQPSWRIANRSVEAFVTRTGGHLAPVRFKLGGRTIEPLHVAPWATERLDRSLLPLLRVLRGDFFCMPFGDNTTPWRNEKHPAHGQTANGAWSLADAESERLHLRMRTTIRPGRVDKIIELRDGQTAVYQRHVLSGMSGPMNPGHHAMLRFPDEAGAGLVSTSPFRVGLTPPWPFEKPENGGYSILRPDTQFHALDRVPCITAEMADLSRYPARRGFEDLVMLVNEAGDFAWRAVAFPHRRYAWFALKDPRVLPQTIFWMSNGGRHYAPWNGRHFNVMGLEEVCSYFNTGLAESTGPNPVSRLGSPTRLKLDRRRPTTINYIMAVVPIPARFEHIDRIERDPGRVTLIDRRGRQVRTRVDHEFLHQS